MNEIIILGLIIGGLTFVLLFSVWLIERRIKNE